ncbi:enoyl-CoA hydratase/isomerase family protein [Trinickia caryophylli]|uniref:Enoyl-CoA hydratase n=1 Tax=Trinickia caryophylli TaxID=28094 RepID=A0A1X7EN26_TRICW|nr:enoyl-CoA hydratase/isomerase family protein [Trinickia caryophylli]PMS10271.1 enoyl-CoA hydratase [Trinickia caryophylli]TRX18741.1 enoyl-CoA hydratase/isomerase family protein [Trinickia caryophylli]WQE10464.1 enoyl-CoA hydratase/isomerase family protein [Trinickia caryophylli]SMF36945.1 enoyl-CoA hydratase [Trinickia caryophylli]GLU32812.1 enoyl-CoA hydratase [Trinickia caryophylli]
MSETAESTGAAERAGEATQPADAAQAAFARSDVYARYRSLRVQRHAHGVLEVVMSGEGANRSNLATADEHMHRELAEIWRDVDRDPATRVAIIRGEGKGFSAGGDLALVEQMAASHDVRTRVWREARELVYNVINCSKPIVSAMHGPAVGAGLVAGLLADVSIAAVDARIIDGHTRLGVAAGDHAAIVWPLLCGMAKAKYHLLLCEPVSGAEAERIGLVSLAVEPADLLPKAFEVATRLALGSQSAIRWTKYALNNWLRLAGPTFDTSLALEFMGFCGPDVQEGIRSLRERRAPEFPDEAGAL